MKKIILSFILLPFLVIAADDWNLAYYGEDSKVEPKRWNVEVNIFPHKDMKSLNDAWDKLDGYKKENNRVGAEVRAFTLVSNTDRRCFVHIIPAKHWDQRDEMAALGHEIYHCLLAEHPKPIDK